MDENDMQRRVDNWVKDTGFPLEMRVAKRFQELEDAADWNIQANCSYLDSSTNSIREIDLLGYLVGRNDTVVVDIEIVLECKATSNPWVILQESFKRQPIYPLVNYEGYFGCLTVTNQQVPQQLSQFTGALASHLTANLPLAPPTGYSIVEAFKSSREKDAAYSATRQVVHATQHRAEVARKVIGNELGITRIIPIIVTTSPLHEAALDEECNDIVTRPVHRSAVEIRAEGNDGDVEVHIINEAGLDSLMNDLKPLYSTIMNFLNSYDQTMVLN